VPAELAAEPAWLDRVAMGPGAAKS
jgi:hypothetical protein